MKKKMAVILIGAAMMVTAVAGCGKSQAKEDPVAENRGNEDVSMSVEKEGEKEAFKIGVVQYVDDASLNQIRASLEKELDKKGEELGASFDYGDYSFNGQADSSTLNQIATELVADQVDVIIPIATPAAMIMQAATEDNQIPVVFSAVSDPVGAGLLKSMEEPGGNITGTSDALDTEAIFQLMSAADGEIGKVGLLYDKSQDSSKMSIEAAKAYCKENGIEVVEKTGTTNDEISLGADALVAAGVDAVFTPTDNTVMTAELAIYEKFIEAKIPHYTGADSFALNGAFCGYGVNYEELGKATAEMVTEILVNGAVPEKMPVKVLDNGIATVNTDTAKAIGIDYSMFAEKCEKIQEIVTAKEFE